MPYTAVPGPNINVFPTGRGGMARMPEQRGASGLFGDEGFFNPQVSQALLDFGTNLLAHSGPSLQPVNPWAGAAAGFQDISETFQEQADQRRRQEAAQSLAQQVQGLPGVSEQIGGIAGSLFGAGMTDEGLRLLMSEYRRGQEPPDMIRSGRSYLQWNPESGQYEQTGIPLPTPARGGGGGGGGARQLSQLITGADYNEMMGRDILPPDMVVEIPRSGNLSVFHRPGQDDPYGISAEEIGTVADQMQQEESRPGWIARQWNALFGEDEETQPLGQASNEDAAAITRQMIEEDPSLAMIYADEYSRMTGRPPEEVLLPSDPFYGR